MFQFQFTKGIIQSEKCFGFNRLRQNSSYIRENLNVIFIVAHNALQLV